jgi:methylglutamate dehydrogenase subunit C
MTSSAPQPMRLASGGLIERADRIRFTFDGKDYAGHPGDTLASALLANDVRLVGRSFKYHRPRGIVSAGSDEPNGLVELGRGDRVEPNTKATTVELFNGLAARSQNRWPSLTFDVGAINQLFSPLIGAGFYYKTFMWPAKFWEHVYEPMIRRAAGLGRLSQRPDPDGYEKADAFCDVLVVGAGPAGLMAALAAGRAGARVILCEEDFRAGGRLLAERDEIDGVPGAAWVENTLRELGGLPDVRLMLRTSVFGCYDTGTYGAIERVGDRSAEPEPYRPRQRLWRITAKRVVLATGALERPIVFGGNDRPGIMQASAVRCYLNRFAVAPGRSFAVLTSNDDGWRTVADLVARGQSVRVVIDTRASADAAVASPVEDCETVFGGRVTSTHGSHRLRGITAIDKTGAVRKFTVDSLAVSGGWNPNLALTSHHGARPVWNDDIAAFVPGQNIPREMIVAGSARGTFGLAGVLREGIECGGEAARALGFSVLPTRPPKTREERCGVTPFWHVAGSKGSAFVDFQNDVTAKDIGLAYADGFRAIEHVKRYTTLGMATDQGKNGNVNGLAILAQISGQPIAALGTTVFRPPYVPVAIGAFAGAHRAEESKPIRLPPSHSWAASQGADFIEAGLWLRARWYRRQGEIDWLESVDREVNTVRSCVGVCDVSTLGKIDVQGTDAGIFLDRVYVNTFSSLAVGKARYGLLLREDGFVMDDGTVSRLADGHYYVSTTTANAVPVMQHFEFCRQVLWPDLDVQIASVSEQWAQFAIAGPKARMLLRSIIDAQFDISNEAIPYLGVRELSACGGLAARLFRLSFSGELAYELAVPARYGAALMRRLIETAIPLGGAPYGTEALSVMRIEKGHPAGGELNGQTTAGDLRLGRMMSKKKDFIGRVMAERPALVDPNRPILTGFKAPDRRTRLNAGAHLFSRGVRAAGDNDEGYMTSVAHSPTLDCWIGLGFLARGAERAGECIRAVDLLRGRDIEVTVCDPAFLDPEGARLRV